MSLEVEPQAIVESSIPLPQTGEPAIEFKTPRMPGMTPEVEALANEVRIRRQERLDRARLIDLTSLRVSRRRLIGGATLKGSIEIASAE